LVEGRRLAIDREFLRGTVSQSWRVASQSTPSSATLAGMPARAPWFGIVGRPAQLKARLVG